jgi:septal ring factor EnvC (AmiA/AmiB activator)
MQDVNSIQQFANLQSTLEQEDKDIKNIENNISRKENDHRRAKAVFDKIDKEIQEMHAKKAELIERRTNLEGKIKNMQRSLDELKRHSSSGALKF